MGFFIVKSKYIKNKDNYMDNNFRLRLRDLREDHDLTQSECAKIGYISKNSYIRYENNERQIPLNIAVIYAAYYNVSLDYLAGLTNISDTTNSNRKRIS